MKFRELFETEVMETATSIEKQRDGGLHHSDLAAALDSSERHAALAARITDCVDRAFHAIGFSMQEAIYWNLFMTKNIARNEIIDKPAEFIEGLQAINGEAWTVVFEYMLRREIRSEFGLTDEFDDEPIKERSTSDLLHLIAHLALES